MEHHLACDRDVEPDSEASGRGADATRWREIRPRLVRLAVKLIWNQDDAEEIAQEAMRLAVSQGPPADAEAFEPWLLRTVSHLCLNKRRRRRAISFELKLLAGGGVEPRQAAERREVLIRLREGIGRLPEQQRITLVLRVMEGMTYEAVAGVMELSVSAVRTHVHLARKRMVEWMSGSGGRYDV
ncbi:MAG: RNA polymerase sigma factor [Phycisphaerae bacterium]